MLTSAAMVLIAGAILFVLLVFAVGHAPRGHALRPVVGAESDAAVPDGAPDLPGWKRWYLETGAGTSPGHSCSFIEFDERGDYLDFLQHRHAYQKILELAEDPRPLTLVVYVHGWRHSGQSQDVVSFNEFLHQLADTEEIEPRRRVHGVYLVWRGSALKHVFDRDDVFQNVTSYFGGPIVDPRARARIGWLTTILESFSYFDRKSVPEYKFSGTALSRTIFSCAFAAKRGRSDCQVMLLGHSFGALLLERTFQNAAISQLTAAWPWGTSDEASPVNPLPFDTVLLVNSAAPSIYAKQLQGYLAAHRQAMLRAHVPRAGTPFVFSVTSSADWATGVAHPIANLPTVLLPTLRRKYGVADFTVENVPENAGIEIPQSYYYRHTPGHNPLLVNRFIEPLVPAPKPPVGKRSHVRRNLMKSHGDLNEFEVATPDGDGTARWSVNFPPATAAFVQFSMYRGRRPVVWTNEHDRYRYKDTAYWIIRCPKEILSSHNDIWNQPAMDVYAALHRIALQARG